MKNYIRILLCLLVLNFPLYLHAKNYFFDQISLNEGLSQSTVRSVFRDHIGLLWIGTKQGLNSYDGSKIKTYYADRSNENSLPNDNISFIAEDEKKNLWIGSDGILCRYDRQNDTFIKEKINGKEISLQNVLIKGDYLYSVTAISIFTYNCKKNTWTEKRLTGDETNVTLACKLEKGTDGKILIGSQWKGLFECNPLTGKLKRTPYFKGQKILDIYRDTKNRLWVSEYGKGVFCFDNEGKRIADLSDADSRSKNDKVMDIIEYHQKLWLVTDGNGILIYSPDKKQFEKIEHEQDNPFSLPVNSLISVYSDNYNNLWLGTIRGGLIGVRNVNIQSYDDAPLNSSSGLSGQTVLSFYEDDDNMVWIGTDEGGINKYNPNSRKFTHFPSTYGKKISGITKFNNKELLISLYKEGLMLFNKQSGSISPFQLQDDYKKSVLLNDLIGFVVYNNNNGSIFISDENVYSYSFTSQSVQKMNLAENSDGAMRMYISHSKPDQLILYSNTMIRLLNMRTRKIEASISVNQQLMGLINAVDQDKSDILWLGMNSGLYNLNLRTKKLNHIKPNLIKTVSTLAIDRNESMWIGNGLDLLRYNIKDHDLIRFQKSDGNYQNEYLPKSRLCTRSGDIYLGGVSGFCRINANIPTKKNTNPTYELLDIQLNGSLVSSKKRTEKNGISSISIPWDYTSLSVNLFMNTPELNNAKHTRYIITGLSNAHNELEKMSVTMPSLPPGNYSLLLQTELKNDEWSNTVNVLNIKVLSPWWRTWWFYLGALFVTTGFLYRLRLNEINKTTRKMDMEMQRRNKDMYEEKVKFLINISHELRTPLTLIYSPLSRLLKDEKTPENLQPLLTLMYKHAKSMKNMIDMVLDIRKMEMSQDILKRGEYHVNGWITIISADFKQELEAKKINLRLKLDEQVELIRFDKNKCDKVLSNLLMNAIKFSDSNTTITIRSEKHDKNIYISVSDEGIGVNTHEVKNLFTRFYQGNHQKGGTGIGLNYAKTQIELHGGTMGYQPGPEKGSIFWFELPLELPQNIMTEYGSNMISESPEVNTGTNQPIQNEDLSKLTILVVEDESDLLNYLKESFAGIFKKVLTAINGEKALNTIQNQMPDFVISDVMMPVMNGFEMCRQIKTNIEISHIPIILLTALDDDDSSLTGYKMGADMYLSKPFSVDLLLTVISNILKSRNEIQTRYSNPNFNIGLNEITFSNADEKFLSKFISLIENKLADSDLLIDNLAIEMAMSRTSFYTKVKIVTGMSANAFITDYKIKKAAHMLHHSDMTIQEIAMDLGFVSQRYFSTVFKQKLGKTPTQHRAERL